MATRSSKYRWQDGQAAMCSISSANGGEAGTVPEESPKLRMASDEPPPQPEPQEAKLEDEAFASSVCLI